MNIYIKDMVSSHCKMVVKEELGKLGIAYSSVNLGSIKMEGDLTDLQMADLKRTLKKSGVQVLESKKKILVERIKNEIFTMIYYSKEMPRVNFPVFLSEVLDHDYTYLSNLFNATVGTTIEQFIIVHKVDRAKELIVYNNLTLKEICYLLNYNNVAQLSSDIKKVTGLSPAYFKKIKQKRTQ